MKVLIVGCQGQVGHCLVQKLVGRPSILALSSSELDITDKNKVKSVFENFKPDFIINAAAYTAVDNAESDEKNAFLINREGVSFLAESAHSVGAVLLHISTDYVFDGYKTAEYTETDITNPQGIYGASKLAGETAILESCPRHIILRTSWVFGEHGNNFVKTMLRLGSERSELNIVDDQFGGPTYAGDIACALITIMDKIAMGNNAWGVYHFSGVPHVSWFEFAQNIFAQAFSQNIIKKKPKLTAISTEQFPTSAKRPQNSKLNCLKINNFFGITASNWQSAIKNIKEYK